MLQTIGYLFKVATSVVTFSTAEENTNSHGSRQARKEDRLSGVCLNLPDCLEEVEKKIELSQGSHYDSKYMDLEFCGKINNIFISSKNEFHFGFITKHSRHHVNNKKYKTTNVVKFYFKHFNFEKNTNDNCVSNRRSFYVGKHVRFKMIECQMKQKVESFAYDVSIIHLQDYVKDEFKFNDPYLRGTVIVAPELINNSVSNTNNNSNDNNDNNDSSTNKNSKKKKKKKKKKNISINIDNNCKHGWIYCEKNNEMYAMMASKNQYFQGSVVFFRESSKLSVCQFVLLS